MGFTVGAGLRAGPYVWNKRQNAWWGQWEPNAPMGRRGRRKGRPLRQYPHKPKKKTA